MCPTGYLPMSDEDPVPASDAERIDSENSRAVSNIRELIDNLKTVREYESQLENESAD
jgi:hypothetical protein